METKEISLSSPEGKRIQRYCTWIGKSTDTVKNTCQVRSILWFKYRAMLIQQYLLNSWAKYILLVTAIEAILLINGWINMLAAVGTWIILMSIGLFAEAFYMIARQQEKKSLLVHILDGMEKITPKVDLGISEADEKIEIWLESHERAVLVSTLIFVAAVLCLMLYAIVIVIWQYREILVPITFAIGTVFLIFVLAYLAVMKSLKVRGLPNDGYTQAFEDFLIRTKELLCLPAKIVK